MLSKYEILKQIKNGNIIIDHLNSKSFDKPNSCRVYLDDYLYTYDYSIIDIKRKQKYLKEVLTGKLETLKKIKIPSKGLILEPNKIYLAKTVEKVTTKGYVPVLHGKTALSLLGVSIELNSGYTYENFDDNFILTIICTKPTIIYPNIDIGNLTFFKSNISNNPNIGMLSGEEIKNRMKSGEIIINPQEDIVINPNSVNLTLNKNICYYTEPILDIKKDNPVESITIEKNGIILYPDNIYIYIYIYQEQMNGQRHTIWYL